MFNRLPKKLPFSEIITIYDDPALTGILYFWDDYCQDTVLIAYAEYIRRGKSLDERLSKKLKKFLFANNKSNIESYLASFLHSEGFSSYQEYYENGVRLLRKNEIPKIDTIINKNNNTFFLLMPVFIAIFLTASNPSLEDHRQKVIDSVNENIDKVAQQTSVDKTYMKAGAEMAKPFIKNAIDNMIKRENYMFFSLTHSKYAQEEKNIGIGILGKVYLFENNFEIPNAGNQAAAPNPSTEIKHKYSYIDNNAEVYGILDLYSNSEYTQAVTSTGMTSRGHGTYSFNGTELNFTSTSGISITGSASTTKDQYGKIIITLARGGRYIQDDDGTLLKSAMTTTTISTKTEPEKECDDITSFDLGYSTAQQQLGNGIMTDCESMWSNIHNQDDGYSYMCFCKGWSKYLREHR
jgi:hypothetical protein